MVIRTGLSTFSSGISNAYNSVGTSTSQFQVGKVYGVITTLNTPTKEAFEANGGFNGIGTIFYLDYNQTTKNKDTVNDILQECSTAKPLYASNQNYPLVGELVLLTNSPSPDSQNNSISVQKYYTGTINVWNNNQQNALSGDTLGKTFSENPDIRNLLSFEGDRIYQGRKGNGIRFGSTVPSYSNISEWSRNGRPNGDPITILVNGYVTTDTGSLTPNIEEINKEMSSIYMTSTQTLPLNPGSDIVNPINSSLSPKNYTDSQIILNSDRITINSKKDEVLLFAKTNMELTTNNILNLNAGEYIHINSEKILLGTKSNNTVPTEPVLLGDQTVILLEKLITALNNLSGYLSSAVSSAEGSPIPAVNHGGTQLSNDMIDVCNQLLKITSNKVYTA